MARVSQIEEAVDRHMSADHMSVDHMSAAVAHVGYFSMSYGAGTAKFVGTEAEFRLLYHQVQKCPHLTLASVCWRAACTLSFGVPQSHCTEEEIQNTARAYVDQLQVLADHSRITNATKADVTGGGIRANIEVTWIPWYLVFAVIAVLAPLTGAAGSRGTICYNLVHRNHRIVQVILLCFVLAGTDAHASNDHVPESEFRLSRDVEHASGRAWEKSQFLPLSGPCVLFLHANLTVVAPPAMDQGVPLITGSVFDVVGSTTIAGGDTPSNFDLYEVQLPAANGTNLASQATISYLVAGNKKSNALYNGKSKSEGLTDGGTRYEETGIATWSPYCSFGGKAVVRFTFNTTVAIARVQFWTAGMEETFDRHMSADRNLNALKPLERGWAVTWHAEFNCGVSVQSFSQSKASMPVFSQSCCWKNVNSALHSDPKGGLALPCTLVALGSALADHLYILHTSDCLTCTGEWLVLAR